MKIILRKFVAVFLIVAFMSLTVACERSVTRYDDNGKPYNSKEFSSMETVGAIVLLMLVLGALAASGSGSGGSNLHEEGDMFAHLNNNNAMTDALSKIDNTMWIQIEDDKGNIISQHLINPDALQSDMGIINMSDIELASEINKDVLRKLIKDISRDNNLNSIPETIRADISILLDKPNVLRISGVNVLSESNLDKGDSVIILDTGHGLYQSIVKATEKIQSFSERSKQYSIVVNQLN